MATTAIHLQDKLTFMGWKLIKEGKADRKVIIAYIQFLLGGRTEFTDGSADFLRREAHYAVSAITSDGIKIHVWEFGTLFFIKWESVSDILLIKSLWNLAFLHRHLTFKQERVVRDAFREVYGNEDTDKFPVLGVTLL